MRGDLVPLTNVARVRIGEGPVEIHREDRSRQITLYANLAHGAPLGVGSQKLEAWGRELAIVAPDELAAAGRARAMMETGTAIRFAFFLALAAIYMILASLFNSLVHPFTIMVSAPLAFIGGFLALWFAGMSLDLMSGIGLLVLLGLVMKNGILLVDYTNQLREQGMERNAAVLRAGPVRLRPVLMTSAALVFGLLPMALSNATGAQFRAPMAVIVIGGLATSTALTLVVVPVFYTLLDGGMAWLRHRLTGGIARLRRRAEPARTTP
jgi:HAE1 family hydrophobic/amphiphilic exporter-1